MGLYVKRGLPVENLFTEKDDIFVSLVAEIFLQPIDETLCLWNYKHFAHFLVHEIFSKQNRPILQIKHVCSVLFYENHQNLAK